MTMTRHLTQNEIEEIIMSLPLNKNIPLEIAESMIHRIRKDLKEDLLEVMINPLAIPELRETITRHYHQSLVQAGESVGMIASQSLGEKQTQITLNTSHFAGLATASVLSGVPRFSQLISASKSTNVAMGYIYPKVECKTISEIRDIFTHTIVETTLKSITKSVDMNLDDSIRYYIDTEKIYEIKLNLKTICDVIGFGASYKSDYSGIIDVECDDKYKIHNELSSIVLCGVNGINSLVYEKDENNMWRGQILMNHQTFEDILCHPLVDKTRVISNDMWDIYYSLGIEATRQFLIDEFHDVIRNGGSFVNLRHIQLMVDVMTFTGIIVAISRFGIKSIDADVFSKASFEESVKKFIDAGMSSISEKCNGVSSAIICGSIPKIGTGICELYYQK